MTMKYPAVIVVAEGQHTRFGYEQQARILDHGTQPVQCATKHPAGTEGQAEYRTSATWGLWFFVPNASGGGRVR